MSAPAAIPTRVSPDLQQLLDTLSGAACRRYPTGAVLVLRTRDFESACQAGAALSQSIP